MRELERLARGAGISQLTLLTQDAREFFAALGYRVIERQAAPEEVRQSAEFRSLCPSSCVCLSKNTRRRRGREKSGPRVTSRP